MKKLQKASETLRSKSVEVAMKKLDTADKYVISRYAANGLFSCSDDEISRFSRTSSMVYTSCLYCRLFQSYNPDIRKHGHIAPMQISLEYFNRW
ncbi:MAG: hypothetical protein WA941_10005 [Nitrososphaeraceae archaeon]